MHSNFTGCRLWCCFTALQLQGCSQDLPNRDQVTTNIRLYERHGLTTPAPFPSVNRTYSHLEVVWKLVRLGLPLFGSPKFPFLRFTSSSAGASWPSAEVFVMGPSATFQPRHGPREARQQLAFVAARSLTWAWCFRARPNPRKINVVHKIEGCPLNKLATDSRLHER